MCIKFYWAKSLFTDFSLSQMCAFTQCILQSVHYVSLLPHGKDSDRCSHIKTPLCTQLEEALMKISSLKMFPNEK